MAKRRRYPKAWHVRSFDGSDVQVLPCEVLRSSIKNDGRVSAQIRIDGSTFVVGEFTVFERRDDAYAEALSLAAKRLGKAQANMMRLEQEAESV